MNDGQKKGVRTRTAEARPSTKGSEHKKTASIKCSLGQAFFPPFNQPPSHCRVFGIVDRLSQRFARQFHHPTLPTLAGCSPPSPTSSKKSKISLAPLVFTRHEPNIFVS